MSESEMDAVPFQKKGVTIVRGRGAILWDDAGREYIDAGASYGVCNAGHSNEHVLGAIRDQMERLTYMQSTIPNDVRGEFLEYLLRRTRMDRAFLCNSGTEAVEAALKYARGSSPRERKVVIAMRGGFHGRTLGALSATWKREYRGPFEPLLPWVRHVRYGDIDAVRDAVSEETCAVLLEPIQGENGVVVPPEGYMRALRELCTEKGSLLIIDEVQTGMGRTGRFFAHEHESVSPDILCLGKSLANGYPMGAAVMTEQVAHIPRSSHGSTFGGNPLACAASLATFRYMERSDLCTHASEMGDRLMRALERRVGSHPWVREVRGQGLMVGIQTKRRVAPLLRRMMEEHRVIALNAGPTVVRLLPPLVIERERLDACVDALATALASSPDGPERGAADERE